MAFDETLPATGVTAFGVLYAALRANYIDLDARITALEAAPSWVELVPAVISPVVWQVDYTTTPYYGKDGLGDVVMKGVAFTVHQPITINGQVITLYDRLPEPYRPAVDAVFPAFVTSSVNPRVAGDANLRIATSGVMSVQIYYAQTYGFVDLGIYFGLVRYRPVV